MTGRFQKFPKPGAGRSSVLLRGSVDATATTKLSPTAMPGSKSSDNKTPPKTTSTSKGRGSLGNNKPPGSLGSNTGAARAPTSLEAELRRIIATTNKSQSELRHFQNGYKVQGVDYTKIKSVGKDVLKVLGVNDLSSLEEFRLEVKADRKREIGLRQKAHYDQLEALCDRAKDFEYCAEIRKRLSQTFHQHLCKYCVSFSEHAKDLDIKCVVEYDSNIAKYKETLTAHITKVDEKTERYGALKTPFVAGFLENSREITQVIDDVTEVNLEMCATMKRWAQEEKVYPRKLWDEMITGNISRGKTMEGLKKLKRKKDDLSHQVHRRDAMKDRASEKLEKAKHERKKAKESVDFAAEKLQKEEAQLEETKKELAENEKQLNERKLNSPRWIDLLWEKCETLRKEIQRSEAHLELYRKHHVRVERAHQDCDKMVQELQEDLESKTIDFHTHVDKLNDVNKETKLRTETLEQQDARLAAVKKIRDMKLSQAVLRKLHYDKLNTEQDALTEACQLVASQIGRNWSTLYLTLPFRPSRDLSRRVHDIEVLDHRSVSLDRTYSACARHSLTRWRQLNHRSSLGQLISGLYKVDRTQLANKLDKDYAVSERSPIS